MIRFPLVVVFPLVVGSAFAQPAAKPKPGYEPFPRDLPQQFLSVAQAYSSSSGEGVSFGYIHRRPTAALVPRFESSLSLALPNRTAMPGLQIEDYNEKMFKALPKVPRPFGAVLRKDKLADGQLAYLAKQDQLVLLDVTFKESTAADTTWAAVARLPRLRHLRVRVQGTATDGPTAAILRAFAKTGLTTLDLIDVRVGPETVKAVADLKSLTGLSVYQTDAFDDAALTATLKALPKLQKLHFGNKTITHAVVPALAAHPALEEIEGHDYRYCRAEDVPALAAAPKLRVLRLGSVRPAGEKLERWTDDAMADLGKAQKLESVDLSDCEQLTDAGYRALFDIPTLTRVRLNAAEKLTTAGLPAATSRLEDIYLSVPEKLDSAGWKTLAGLPKLKAFGVFLGKTLTDADLDAFTQMKGLEALSVGSCKLLTPAALKNVDRLRNLHTLHLTGLSDDLQVDDAALAKIALLPKLERLSVNTSKAATDAGLRSISKLKTLKDLTVYTHKESKMTREAKAAVRTALPNCETYISD